MVTTTPVGSGNIGARERAVRNRLMQRLLALLLLATVLSIVQVWSRMQVLNVRYALTAVQQRIAELQKTVTQRESDVASLQSVERLTAVARDTLGMMPPQPGQVVVVRAPSSSRE